MKTLTTITALLICSLLFGQSKTFLNIAKPNGDSTFWYQYVTARTKKLYLPLLDTSAYPEYIRIWTNTQAIDIWQEEGNFYGKLTTWTDEYAGGDEEPTNRTFIKTKWLSSDTLSLLRNLVASSNILELPTEDSIAGWQQGFDGVTYFIEHSTKDSYSFKSYWTPEVQDSLKEAIKVQSFIDSAFLLVNSQAVWKVFSKEIPFESYYNGGPGVAVRILTETERKKYRKERKNYRQHCIAKIRAGH